MNEINQPPQIEERRLKLEQERLRLDSSFARKWLPTLATVVIGFLGAVFGFAQYINTTEETKRARIDANTRETLAQSEARTRNERDWSIKIVEMY